VPRRINALAAEALRISKAHGERTVTLEHVQAAAVALGGFVPAAISRTGRIRTRQTRPPLLRLRSRRRRLRGRTESCAARRTGGGPRTVTRSAPPSAAQPRPARAPTPAPARAPSRFHPSP
jgi:hypothetical protein